MAVSRKWMLISHFLTIAKMEIIGKIHIGQNVPQKRPKSESKSGFSPLIINGFSKFFFVWFLIL